MAAGNGVGNQLPILLISFGVSVLPLPEGWESVTNPLDKLFLIELHSAGLLGISYQSS